VTDKRKGRPQSDKSRKAAGHNVSFGKPGFRACAARRRAAGPPVTTEAPNQFILSVRGTAKIGSVQGWVGPTTLREPNGLLRPIVDRSADRTLPEEFRKAVSLQYITTNAGPPRSWPPICTSREMTHRSAHPPKGTTMTKLDRVIYTAKAHTRAAGIEGEHQCCVRLRAF
jgi:hypothetical protein